MDDFFLPLLLTNTEPNSLSDAIRAVYKQHFPSGKRISIDHQVMNAIENLIDVMDRILIQTTLDISTYEMFGLSRLVSYLTDGIAFGNVLPEPRVRPEYLLNAPEIPFNETVATGFAFEFRVSHVVLPILFKVRRRAFRAFFFALSDG